MNLLTPHPLPGRTVADVAREGVGATRVLQRHRIDFCCGGARPFAEACAVRGLAPDAVLAEIAAEAPEPDEVGWTTAPLADLIAHILVRFHEPLREELPRLEALARKVARVHGDRHPELVLVRDAFLALAGDLVPHLDKEEQILFPWVLGGRGETASEPIRALEDEHLEAGALLAELRALSGGYDLPADACGSWRALWEGLEALETDLHAHIHLENNVLHPRALRGE